MRKTALYEIHKKNNAKIVDFAGWQMPVVYSGIRDEHLSVRKGVGIFDVSHMGEIRVKGDQALDFCQYITTNNLKNVKDNQAQYTLLCEESGGVVDDIIIYRFGNDEYFLCVNAANAKKDFEWINSLSKDFDVRVVDESLSFSQIAVQGPNSRELLKKILGSELDLIKKFYFNFLKWNGSLLTVARTGYTGEEGYEIFLPWDRGPQFWKKLFEKGVQYGITPCGLGARDTLRLEMGYSLYGFEIDKDINPLESGLDRYVKLEGDDFVGKKALSEYQKSGIKRKLISFEMVDKGIPRNGYPIFVNNDLAGYVTSGTLSPSLGKSIGLGLVKSDSLNSGEIQVEIRNNMRKARIVSLPFIK
jgi:aminomethyltransferase